MNKEFIPLKKAFEKNGWTWKYNDDLAKNIRVKNKGHMWLYNYGDVKLVEKDHPVLIKCRGLIVSENGIVLNYPFERFFNDFEDEKADIDWDTARIQEKVDGSLICVFYNGEDWEITTRGSFYPAEKAEVDFSKLFMKHFPKDNVLNPNCCYMFELVTKHNRIVKWYSEEGVYLVGIRFLDTFEEIPSDDLDIIAMELKVNRPKIFRAMNFEQCRKLFEDFKDDDEGLVVVDENFNRVKLKQESYFKLSKIKMLKEQDLFEYVLGITTIDEEYLEKCPDVIEGINDIEMQWTKITKKTDEVFEKIKDKPSRREFADEAIKYPFKPFLFLKLDGKEINIKFNKWRWKKIKEWVKE